VEDFRVLLRWWFLRCCCFLVVVFVVVVFAVVVFVMVFFYWRRFLLWCFVITERTKVCSLHFKSEDLRKSINGRIYVKEGGIPSKFDWSGPSPKKRKAPTERQPLPAKKKLLTEETVEMFAFEPSTSFEVDTCETQDLERQISEQTTTGWITKAWKWMQGT